MRNDEQEMELALSLPSALPNPAATATIPRVAAATPSDGELLERVGRGDRDAFDTIYRRYARPMFGLALRRLGDRGRAEDAVQETFASVWRSARTYRPEVGPGAPWLYAIARHAIVDRARARTETPGEVPDTAAPDPGPPERAEADWLAWRVHAAIGQLAESERIVLELAYWSGLSQSEVAHFLNIPLGTVKTRTRSALRRLSELLGEELR